MKYSPIFTLRTLLLALSATVLASCRVGEDDPLLSLSSRNARLMGEWKVTEWTYEERYESTQTSNTGSTYKRLEIDVFSMNGATGTMQAISGVAYDGEPMVADSSTNTFSRFGVTISILEKGVLEMASDLAYTSPSGVAVNSTDAITTGWFWVDQDEDKAAIALNGTAYTIVELRKDRMVLTSNQKSVMTQLQNLDGTTITANGESRYTERMVLEAVK